MNDTTIFRTNADGFAVCPHRDLGCCPTCVATTPELVDVMGAHMYIADPAEREQLRAELAEIIA